MQDKRQLFGYISSIVLAFATFLPVATLPLVGSLNYFNNGQGDGTFILLAAIAAGVLVYLKKYNFLLIPGILAAALTLFDLIAMIAKINDMKASLNESLAGNPFAGIAQGLANSVQLQWGWFILLLAEAAVVLVALNVLPKEAPKTE